MINVIYTFTSLFSFVYVITAGGPGFATTTVDYFTYLTTFENGQFGYGAALALLLFLIVLTLTIAQVKLFPNREVQQGSLVVTSRISRTVVFIVLCLIAVSTVYPLIFMALNSMRSSSSFELSPFGFPSHWNFSSYRSLFQQVPFAQSILHSFIVVVPAVILATFTSSLAAFVFTKVPVKLGNAMFWVMLMIIVHARHRGARYSPLRGGRSHGVFRTQLCPTDSHLHRNQYSLRHLSASL